ncbi:prolipoprotein diacylglyceryl transferase [bacterium SCSIO 12741]|nr:prolipoprotein diacylglyceryl transferase [bacterium SCSIO 12741]
MIINSIHWNLDPELINLFGISIRYYGLFFASGIILCLYLLGKLFKAEGIPAGNLDKLAIYGILGVILGARLGHCLFYEASYYLSHPIEMLLPIRFTPDGAIQFTGYRGLASHGGVLGVLIALYIYSRKTKHAMIDALDLIAVTAGFTLGFIRLGNFMNSEIIGMPTNLPWGVVFERIDEIPRHPAQLYEAFSYLLIGTLMLMLYTKKRDKLKNGFLFGLTTVLFFTARFLIEFVKENQVGFEQNLTFNMGQLLSLPYIAIGVGFMIYGLWKTNKSQSSSEKTI